MVDFVSTNPEQDSRKSSKTYKRYPIHAFFFPLSNSGLWVGLGDSPGQVLGYYRVNTLTIVHAHIYISSQFTVKSPNPLNCGKKLEYLPKNMQTLGRLANAIEKAQTQNILALKWQCNADHCCPKCFEKSPMQNMKWKWCTRMLHPF